MNESIWDKPVSQDEILKQIWKHLDLGVLDRHHAFHTPVFATELNSEANVRVVILRRFWRKPAKLAFHTHIGSPKIAEIKANPRVSWLFYNPTEKLQLRVKGLAEIHTGDELAEEQWMATNFFSRRCYIGESPTTVSKTVTSGLPEHLVDREPTKEESEIGRANFTVISSTISSIDCLELAVRGNRRSQFIWSENGELETKWLTP
jgi:pyridoxamine 5'-phosphate oxidase